MLVLSKFKDFMALAAGHVEQGVVVVGYTSRLMDSYKIKCKEETPQPAFKTPLSEVIRNRGNRQLVVRMIDSVATSLEERDLKAKRSQNGSKASRAKRLKRTEGQSSKMHSSIAHMSLQCKDHVRLLL